MKRHLPLLCAAALLGGACRSSGTPASAFRPLPEEGPVARPHEPWRDIRFLAGPGNEALEPGADEAVPLALDGTVARVGPRTVSLKRLLTELHTRHPDLFWVSFDSVLDQAMLQLEIERREIVVDDAVVERVYQDYDRRAREHYAREFSDGAMRYEDFLLDQLRRQFAYFGDVTLEGLEHRIKQQFRRQLIPYRYLLEMELQARSWVKVRHVLYHDEDAARQGRRKLVEGGYRFGKLAELESKDPSAADNKGDLGVRFQGELIDAVDRAAFALPIGEISEPVASDFGFHLIEVIERHQGRQVSFEVLRPELEAALDFEKGYPVQLQRSFKESWKQRYHPEDFLRAAMGLPEIPSSSSPPSGSSDEQKTPAHH